MATTQVLSWFGIENVENKQIHSLRYIPEILYTVPRVRGCIEVISGLNKSVEKIKPMKQAMKVHEEKCD